MQERLIPNNVTAKFTFTRSRPDFCIMSHETGRTKGYQVVIEEAALEARRVKLSASEQLRLERSIVSNGARYPLTHVVTRHFAIPSGVSSIDLDALFTGQIPNKIIMGFVTNAAFNGTYSLNPFRFQHFGLNSAYLIVDGRQVPSHGMQCDFSRGLYGDLYHYLVRVTGPYPHNGGSALSTDQFQGGSTLLAYDLTADQSGDGVDYVGPRRTGTVRASLRFATPLAQTVTVVVLGQFDNTIVIDRHRSVVYDYTT
jgi:hypothetical protein